jgi:uncharacterized membrane protein
VARAKPPAPPAGPSSQAAKRRDVTALASWSGPLPPPAALEAFEKIVPGAAGRIVDEFQKESDHRRRLERREASFVQWDTHIGQALAIVFALSAFGVVAFAIYRNAPWVAGVLGASVIGAGVVAFLRGRGGS